MSKVSEEVEKLILPIAEKFGLEIVEIQFTKKQNGDNLTVFIDKPGGVTLDDCEILHNAINDPLDELDPTAGKPYTLNVSSPGLDRPIVTDKDFIRNLYEMIEIKLYKPVNKKKHYIGKLLGLINDNQTICLGLNGSDTDVTDIDRNLIAKATKYIDF